MPQKISCPALRLLRISRASQHLYKPVASCSRSRNILPQLASPVRFFASSPRKLAVPPPPNDADIPVKQMTAGEYERISDTDMDILHENLELLFEEYMTGGEVEYSSGVMTLKTPKGTYVINKQPPNQQIWISSPLSGPARFSYSPEGVWVHHRKKGVTLGGLLDEEFKGIAGETEWGGVGLA